MIVHYCVSREQSIAFLPVHLISHHKRTDRLWPIQPLISSGKFILARTGITDVFSANETDWWLVSI